MTAPGETTAGLVLAAGAGSRFGSPKALARAADGTAWSERAVAVLRDVGCSPLFVALGAEADLAERLVPADAVSLRVSDWQEGISAAIAAGVMGARDAGSRALVIVPVDTPDAPTSAAERIIRAAARRPRAALVQATYRGVPGHPVFIGADHFAPLLNALSGDRGARAYLVENGVVEVECSDLWSGADIDSPRDA